MFATKYDVSDTLPRFAVSRLVGHDAPIQAVCFTGKLHFVLNV